MDRSVHDRGQRRASARTAHSQGFSHLHGTAGTRLGVPGRSEMTWVFSFADPLPPDAGDAKVLLGGKGASLQEMTRAGLQVPPGFTLRTDCCRRYFENNQRWPDGLEAEVRTHLAQLEANTGRTWGRGPEPLLVSVS